MLKVSARLKDTKFAREGQALDRLGDLPLTVSDGPCIADSDTRYSPQHRFFKMLDTDELRAWYGEGHVFKAAERGAIGTLLITDNLFRYGPVLDASLLVTQLPRVADDRERVLTPFVGPDS